MRNQTVNYSIPSVYHNTSWTDQISDAPVMLGTSVSLEPYEYLVLKK